MGNYVEGAFVTAQVVGSDPQVSLGVERLVAMPLPERPGRNAASLQPPTRSPRHWRVGQGRASPRPLEAKLLDMVLAYAHLQERRDTQACGQAQLGRFSAFGPQAAAALAP